MIGRRRFLEVASLGLASAGLGSTEAPGQAPSSRARPTAAPGPAPEADEQVNRVLGQARTDGRRLPGMIGGIVRGEVLEKVGAGLVNI